MVTFKTTTNQHRQWASTYTTDLPLLTLRSSPPLRPYQGRLFIWILGIYTTDYVWTCRYRPSDPPIPSDPTKAACSFGYWESTPDRPWESTLATLPTTLHLVVHLEIHCYTTDGPTMVTFQTTTLRYLLLPACSFLPTTTLWYSYSYIPTDLPIPPSDPPVLPPSDPPFLPSLPSMTDPPILPPSDPPILRLSGRASHSEMVDPTSRTVGKAIHNNNLATLQGSKERSAWVSHRAMAIMASQTVGNAMHSNPSFFKCCQDQRRGVHGYH